MQNLFLKNIPSINEREFKYRSKMNSHDLNQMQKETFDDILDLFNKANGLQKEIYEMNLANNIESVCYTKRLQEAITNFEKLKEKYDNLTSTENDFRYITRFAYDASFTENGYEATIDKNTNDIIAHIVSSTSKTKMYDETYDETLIPPTLQVYAGPDTFQVGGDILSIEDSDINNIFSGSNGNVWCRKVITTPNVESIENEIIIGLPEDIITSRLVNEIILKTFPIGYVDILDVKYKSNGSWQSIPGFKNHHECEEYEDTDIFGNISRYTAIQNASNLKFNFQDIQTNQIKIKLRQRNYEYDPSTNRRTWYLGLRDVDIIHNVYTKDHSEFEMTFDFPETDKDIKIYDTEVYFNNVNDKNTDEIFNIYKEYYYFDSIGNTHKIPSTCPFILNGHKIMVRITIEGTQNTPNIHKCRIKYKLA